MNYFRVAELVMFFLGGVSTTLVYSVLPIMAAFMVGVLIICAIGFGEMDAR